jgi:hypothetical protein
MVMKRMGFCLLILCQLGLAMAGDSEDRIAASRAVAQEFMGTLKAELMKAIKDGGPANAIRVCKNRASEIVAQNNENNGGQA